MSRNTPELPYDLDACARSFRRDQVRTQALVQGLTDREFLMPPARGEWSVAQCLDHLNVQGGKMLPGLDRGIAEAVAQAGTRSTLHFAEREPPGRIRYGWFDRWFVRAVSPGRDHGRPGNAMRTQRAFEPRPNLTLAVVVPAFLTLQEELLFRVQRARGLELGQVKVRSVVTPLIRVRLGAWFAAIALHQERHFDQARRAREAIGRLLVAWPEDPVVLRP